MYLQLFASRADPNDRHRIGKLSWALSWQVRPNSSAFRPPSQNFCTPLNRPLAPFGASHSVSPDPNHTHHGYNGGSRSGATGRGLRPTALRALQARRRSLPMGFFLGISHPHRNGLHEHRQMSAVPRRRADRQDRPAEPLPASAVPIEEAARPLIAVALYVAGSS
jgi:hypothetical protein